MLKSAKFGKKGQAAYNRAVARNGGGDFKLVMIQSSHRFGLAASSPNLSESSLAGWAPALAFAPLSLWPFGLATRALQTGGLIES